MSDKTLMILDDDGPLRNRLRRAMESRGFDVLDAGTVSEGAEIVRKEAPAYAILDMKLEDGSGLNLVQDLNKKTPRLQDCDVDRFWQYRDSGCGCKGRGIGLPAQTGGS